MIQTQAIEVDYSKLVLADDVNARNAGDYDDAGIQELAALIKAKGLIQPIVVRSAKGGKHEVFAGKRRYLAIGKLIETGDWQGPVPATLRDENDREALETSLIENIARKQMHPVNEFEVFAEIHAKGGKTGTIEAIAERYGVTTEIVRQRLALGRLAPEIRDAWRNREINADVAMAFAVCRDPKQQADGYKRLKKQNGGRIWENAVRHHFVKDKAGLDDKRVLFVGLERYKAEGGTLVEDLFGRDGYIENGPLLTKLVKVRMKEICEQLIADGWSWAQPVEELGNAHYSWGTLDARKKYTPEEREQSKALQKEIAVANDPDADDDERADRRDLNREWHAMEAAATARGFNAEQRAKSGCIVDVNGHSGPIKYGVVRNVSQAKLNKKKEKKKAAVENGADPAAAEAETDDAEISNALMSDITSIQTKALVEALAQCPALAVRIAAAALAPRYGYSKPPVRLDPDGLMKCANFNPVDEADDEDEEAEDTKSRKSGFAEAFAAIDEKRAAAVLAVNLGRAVDVRRALWSSSPDHDIDALVSSFPGDVYLKAIRKEFSAEDFFTRAPARVAEAALVEIEGRNTCISKKKVDLAGHAADAAKRVGWLPLALRHPDYAIDASQTADARYAASTRSGASTEGKKRVRVPA